MTWQPNDALMTRAMEAFWDAPEGGNTAGVRAALIACRDDMVAEAVRDLARLVAEGLDLCAQARAIDAALENTTKMTPILWATEHYHARLAAWESRASLAIRARHP